MPEISLPPFQINYHNSTLSFSQVCAELGSGIIVVPLVAILANVAIAKAFSKSFLNEKHTVTVTIQMTATILFMEFVSIIFSNWTSCRCITRNDYTGLV